MMGFEELQSIWDSQNDEDLYTINEDALFAQIQEKSKSVDQKLNVYELMMFIGNLFVGMVLFVDVWRGDGRPYQYILPAIYVFFSLVAVLIRRVRRKEEIQFDLSVAGELDKAIWQVDHLIKWSRSMMVWYMLPLMLVLSGTLWLNGKPLWALGMLVILIPLSTISGRWEINKWYVPKKLELEALRKQLRDEN